MDPILLSARARELVTLAALTPGSRPNCASASAPTVQARTGSGTDRLYRRAGPAPVWPPGNDAL